ADVYADIAVLKVSAKVPSYASFGNSDTLKQGETVIAIGSPLGDFHNSGTVGVVSATGRTVDTSNNYQMQDLIQTDAAINHGNSGGPLVDLAGQVVGINTAIITGGRGYEGVGFALPSTTAINVYDQIIKQGRVTRGSIGVSFQEELSTNAITLKSLGAQYGLVIEGAAP